MRKKPWEEADSKKGTHPYLGDYKSYIFYDYMVIQCNKEIHLKKKKVGGELNGLAAKTLNNGVNPSGLSKTVNT